MRQHPGRFSRLIGRILSADGLPGCLILHCLILGTTAILLSALALLGLALKCRGICLLVFWLGGIFVLTSLFYIAAYGRKNQNKKNHKDKKQYG
jgi:hypothetical protein